MDRDQKIQDIRPPLQLDNSNTKPLERFQNEALRPILKLQHELTQSILLNHKNYKSLKITKLKKQEYQGAIKTFIQTNGDLKNQLLGIVIGHFTNTELSFYMNDRKEINKRIFQMQLNRYVDTLLAQDNT